MRWGTLLEIVPYLHIRLEVEVEGVEEGMEDVVEAVVVVAELL